MVFRTIPIVRTTTEFIWVEYRMKKALVIEVILLFLGVGIQPALANEISTNALSDVDEDCFECQVSNVFRHLQAKMMLIKPKAVKNHLSSSNNNNKECFILQIKFNIATTKFIILLYLAIYLDPIFPSLAQKMEDLAFYYFKKSDEFLRTAIDLNCYWVYY